MSAAMSSPTGTVPLNAGVKSTLSPTLFPACISKRSPHPLGGQCKMHAVIISTTLRKEIQLKQPLTPSTNCMRNDSTSRDTLALASAYFHRQRTSGWGMAGAYRKQHSQKIRLPGSTMPRWHKLCTHQSSCVSWWWAALACTPESPAPAERKA